MSEITPALSDACGYLERVIAALRQNDRTDRDKGRLLEVLDRISQYVLATRQEIARLHEGDGRGGSVSDATRELDVVVSETASATHEILTAAEAIDGLAPQGERGAAVKDLVTRIYTACAFQDITGQRIANVVRTLQDVDAKVTTLVEACGGDAELGPRRNGKDLSYEESLLNGPARATTAAPTQDEIDRLFAEL